MRAQAVLMRGSYLVFVGVIPMGQRVLPHLLVQPCLVGWEVRLCCSPEDIEFSLSPSPLYLSLSLSLSWYMCVRGQSFLHCLKKCHLQVRDYLFLHRHKHDNQVSSSTHLP